MHKQRLFIAIAGAVGVIAAFLPWISATMPFFGTVSVSGISGMVGDGWITLGLSGAAAGLAIAKGDKTQELDAQMKKIIGGLGAGIAGYLLFFMFIRAQGGLSVMGMGVWLTLLAGLVVMAIPFVIKGDGGFEMPNKDTIKEDLK